jgi:hypothetical protein
MGDRLGSMSSWKPLGRTRVRVEGQRQNKLSDQFHRECVIEKGMRYETSRCKLYLPTEEEEKDEKIAPL